MVDVPDFNVIWARNRSYTTLSCTSRSASALLSPNILSLNRNITHLLFFFFFSCQPYADGRSLASLCEVSSEKSIIGSKTEKLQRETLLETLDSYVQIKYLQRSDRALKNVRCVFNLHN